MRSLLRRAGLLPQVEPPHRRERRGNCRKPMTGWTLPNLPSACPSAVFKCRPVALPPISRTMPRRAQPGSAVQYPSTRGRPPRTPAGQCGRLCPAGRSSRRCRELGWRRLGCRKLSCPDWFAGGAGRGNRGPGDRLWNVRTRLLTAAGGARRGRSDRDGGCQRRRYSGTRAADEGEC